MTDFQAFLRRTKTSPLRLKTMNDAMLIQLQPLSNLRTLRIPSGRRDVTDAGLNHLAEMKHLQTLEIKTLQITREGINRLKAALPQCKIISNFGTLEVIQDDAPDDRSQPSTSEQTR